MIVISGTSCKLHANLLPSMIWDWCIQHTNFVWQTHNTVLIRAEAPFNPLFIVRYFKHAEQKMQSRSPLTLTKCRPCLP